MSNVAARFVVSPSSPIETKFEVNVQNNKHNLLSNRDLPDQHPIESITGLQEALDSIPTDVVTEQELNTALAAKQDVLTAGANIQINNNVISATDTTYTAGTGIDITNGVISNTQTSAEWGNITGTLADQTDLKNALDELSGGIDSNHQAIGGINQALSTYGNIVTHNTSEFATASQGALADTAIQPNDNISELNNNVGYITGITSNDVTTALGYTPYNSSNPSNYQTATQVANSIATETTNRENADNNLQSQIDAIVSSSDVFDIVGTYAELQAYDITTVPVNDIIKVLVDSTHSGAATYYRCVETGGVKSWSYIGSEGAYYTKAEADAAFVPQTRTVNSKALSSNISLTAADVGADVSGAASAAETNAKNYADGLSVNYATAAQGALADTAVQPADLATVATSGSYNDLSNKPTIPAAQVNSDWNATTGVAQILNKPTIPTVNNPTITFTQDGTTKGTITLNQSSDQTIELDAGSSYTAGTGISIVSDVISVTAPTLTNTATGSDSYSVGGTAAGRLACSFGYNAIASGARTTAIGEQAQATAQYATAIGGAAAAGADYAIQIGYGTNITANTLSVGFRTSNSLLAKNWQLLDGTTGYIPNARINMDSTPTSASTNTVTSGGVYTALSGKADTSSLATVATTGVYSDLTGTPTIPTVNNPTITITQGGVTKGSFTLNQATGDTIALDEGGSSYTAGTGIDITSDVISVDSTVVTTNTDQNISGIKTFVGEKRIKFKQSASGNKLGFTLYDNNNKEAAAFEYRPNAINSYPLMYLGQYIGSSSVSYVSTPIYVGFRLYDWANTASYNLVAPLAKDAKSSFSLNGLYKTFYLPLGVTDGNTTVTTGSNGVLDISSLLPTMEAFTAAEIQTIWESV